MEQQLLYKLHMDFLNSFNLAHETLKIERVLGFVNTLNKKIMIVLKENKNEWKMLLLQSFIVIALRRGCL